MARARTAAQMARLVAQWRASGEPQARVRRRPRAPGRDRGGLRSRGRDVDCGEFARTVQAGQGIAVATVRLDAVAAALRHARRIDADAVLALAGEIAMSPDPHGPAA